MKFFKTYHYTSLPCRSSTLQRTTLQYRMWSSNDLEVICKLGHLLAKKLFFFKLNEPKQKLLVYSSCCLILVALDGYNYPRLHLSRILKIEGVHFCINCWGRGALTFSMTAFHRFCAKLGFCMLQLLGSDQDLHCLPCSLVPWFWLWN